MFKQHPLPNHFWAEVASEAVLAAADQGRFLEMDQLIFSQQRAISQMLQGKAAAMGKPADQARAVDVQREVFIDLAAQLGLDVGRFRSQLENRTHLARIRAEIAEARKVGATGTPASFVNGRFVSGAQPFQVFQREIQKEIDWARNGNRPAFRKGTSVAELRPPRQRGPDPKKVYNLRAGESPAVGAADAKVTVLHYMDYQ